ncbi:nucleoside permease [Litorimonas cladophorae]|uniref:Nucleoside permease n=1 Tax=Litorimonas cladophorae TaxID=1220491 RepID=A0A918NHJ3_9PROT|nr:nucleoside transporter C-terminal domain-containing protein [Litorimonas cladophorae]GGX73575.1 nucleoside permease [Litorimonas cladophorae]
MTGIIGIFVLLGVAWLFSDAKKSVRYDLAARTLALQIAIAIFALLTPVGDVVLGAMSAGVEAMTGYVKQGTVFMFGELGDEKGGTNVIFFFQILPIIIFIAALFAILFHLRIMGWIIRGIGGVVRRITGASRLESTCAAANIFVGMAEAPLTVLPYLPKITRSQLFVMMSLGLSSVAGTVLVAYSAIGIDPKLLITAALMAAPGGLLMGRILVPETETPFDIDSLDAKDVDKNRAGSLIEALTNGAMTGLQIMLAVMALLVAVLSVIALINGIMGGIGGWFGYPDLSLEGVFSVLFRPVAWMIGVPWDESAAAGRFLGEKVVLNEFLAYFNFTGVKDDFSVQGQIAITLALCGFANFGGLAILIAGLSAVVPERKTEISKLGLRTVLAGNLSNFMSAAIASVVIAVASLAGMTPI